jgi:hypothetical protein
MPVRIAVAEEHIKFHNSDRKRIEVEKELRLKLAQVSDVLLE